MKLLGVTALALSREAVVGAPQLLIVLAALLLLAVTRVHPAALLAAGGLAGWLSKWTLIGDLVGEVGGEARALGDGHHQLP